MQDAAAACSNQFDLEKSLYPFPTPAISPNVVSGDITELLQI